MPQRPYILYGGDRACYSPKLDNVKLPNQVAFKSPEELYLIVRGPYGIGKPDTYKMGAGLTKGQVVKIYRTYLKQLGVSA